MLPTVFFAIIRDDPIRVSMATYFAQVRFLAQIANLHHQERNPTLAYTAKKVMLRLT